jgi:hypothetical protein
MRDLAASNAARGVDAVDEMHMTIDGSKSLDSVTRLPPKRPGLESHQTTEFICSMCSKGGVCLGCGDVALEPESLGPQKSEEEISCSDSVIVIDRDPALPSGTGALRLTVPSKALRNFCSAASSANDWRTMRTSPPIDP